MPKVVRCRSLKQAFEIKSRFAGYASDSSHTNTLGGVNTMSNYRSFRGSVSRVYNRISSPLNLSSSTDSETADRAFRLATRKLSLPKHPLPIRVIKAK